MFHAAWMKKAYSGLFMSVSRGEKLGLAQSPPSK